MYLRARWPELTAPVDSVCHLKNASSQPTSHHYRDKVFSRNHPPEEQWPRASAGRQQPREASDPVPRRSGQNPTISPSTGVLSNHPDVEVDLAHTKGTKSLWKQEGYNKSLTQSICRFGDLLSPSPPRQHRDKDGGKCGRGDQGSVTASADKAAFWREDISICSTDT